MAAGEVGEDQKARVMVRNGAKSEEAMFAVLCWYTGMEEGEGRWR